MCSIKWQIDKIISELELNGWRTNMDKIKVIKWTSTAAVLTGIALTNLNIYPVNIMIHGAGATGWTIAGFITKDRALLTNFCLQLPLFIFGIINYFL
tara:strand:- start:34 stop:324 length:291 start_codon:yes stop_codon:yes gene_type:complete